MAIFRDAHVLPRTPHCARQTAMQVAVWVSTNEGDELFDYGIIAKVGKILTKPEMFYPIALGGAPKLAVRSTAKLEK